MATVYLGLVTIEANQISRRGNRINNFDTKFLISINESGRFSKAQQQNRNPQRTRLDKISEKWATATGHSINNLHKSKPISCSHPSMRPINIIFERINTNGKSPGILPFHWEQNLGLGCRVRNGWVQQSMLRSLLKTLWHHEPVFPPPPPPQQHLRKLRGKVWLHIKKNLVYFRRMGFLRYLTAFFRFKLQFPFNSTPFNTQYDVLYNNANPSCPLGEHRPPAKLASNPTFDMSKDGYE